RVACLCARQHVLPASLSAILLPRLQSDEFSRDHEPHLQLRPGAGGMAEGRTRAREHRRLDDLRRHVGNRDRRRRGPGDDRDQGDEGPRLSDRFLGRRDRGLGNARPHHSAFAAAFLALMTPVILLGGMTVGIFTPTEGAIIASAYALALGLLWYRTLSLKMLVKISMDTIETTATVLLIVAAASIFGWLLTV